MGANGKRQGKRSPRKRNRSPRKESAAASAADLLRQACQLHQAGDLPGARKLYAEVLRQAPKNADALHLLGVSDHQLGDHESAAARIAAALAISPSKAAYSNLSAVYQALAKPQTALAAARQAIALDAGFVDGLVNLGKSLAANRMPEDAAAAFRRVLTIAPGHVEAAGQLAYLLETANQLDEAAALAAAGLARAPRDVLLNLVAAKCERRTGHVDAALSRLRQLLQDVPAASDDRFVHFEMGALCDRRESPDEAFAHFTRANALARQQCPPAEYEQNAQVRQIRRMAQTCKPKWLAQWRPAPPWPAEDTPIFVFGFPRSGNTLLDQMLDSHPALSTRQETPALWRAAAVVEKLPGGYPAALATLSDARIDELQAIYFAAHDWRPGRTTDGGRPRLVDTYPLATIHVPLIVRLFPAAKLVMTVRHPLDVCLSCFMHDFKLNEAMANFTDLHDTAALYADVMKLWRQYGDLFALHPHVIRYEDLVADAGGQLQRLCKYLSIPWDDAMLQFDAHAQARGRINTPSYHQVTEGIYDRACWRHRRYERHLTSLAGRLAPLVEHFGYQ